MKQLHISPAEYHSRLTFNPKALPDLAAAGHLSASTLCAAADPLSFLFGKPRKATAAMDYGNVLDTVLLTPELFDSLYVVLPQDAPQKPTKAMLGAKKPGPESLMRQEWWTNFERLPNGRTPVTHALMSDVRAAESMFRQHKLASSILTDSQTQLALEGPNPLGYPGLAKCLIDLFPVKGRFHGAVADFKTTNDVTERGMTNTIWKFSYHVKMAWYGLCLEAAGMGPVNQHVLVWQKSSFPFTVHVREIHPDDIECGKRIIHKRIREMQVMSSLDIANLFDEDLQTLELAPWQREHDPALADDDGVELEED